MKKDFLTEIQFDTFKTLNHLIESFEYLLPSYQVKNMQRLNLTFGNDRDLGSIPSLFPAFDNENIYIGWLSCMKNSAALTGWSADMYSLQDDKTISWMKDLLIDEVPKMVQFVSLIPNYNQIAATFASAQIGSDPLNGIVTITDVNAGISGNLYTIKVEAGIGASVPLTSVLTGFNLVVTLPTDIGGLAISTSAATVSASIALLPEFTSIYSGTGSSFIGPSVLQNFTGGANASNWVDTLINFNGIRLSF